MCCRTLSVGRSGSEEIASVKPASAGHCPQPAQTTFALLTAPQLHSLLQQGDRTRMRRQPACSAVFMPSHQPGGFRVEEG